MHRAVLVVLLVLASPAGAQTDAAPPPGPDRPAPVEVAPPPAAPAVPAQFPGEIVVPQYPPGVAPPSDAAVKLDPAAYTRWRTEKLSFAAGSSRVVRGLKAEPVNRVDFYNIVGRPDLAAKQEDGRRRQIWFFAGGAAVTAAGLIGGIALANSNDAPITYGTTVPEFCYPPQCTISTHTWQTTTGTLIAVTGALAGGVLIALGLVAGNPVTTEDEDRTLVGEYNDLLLQKLANPPKAAAPSPVPVVGFQIGSGGGMLQAGWRF